jgi:hypothetical protein
VVIRGRPGEGLSCGRRGCLRSLTLMKDVEEMRRLRTQASQSGGNPRARRTSSRYSQDSESNAFLKTTLIRTDGIFCLERWTGISRTDKKVCIISRPLTKAI